MERMETTEACLRRLEELYPKYIEVGHGKEAKDKDMMLQYNKMLMFALDDLEERLDIEKGLAELDKIELILKQMILKQSRNGVSAKGRMRIEREDGCRCSIVIEAAVLSEHIALSCNYIKSMITISLCDISTEVYRKMGKSVPKEGVTDQIIEVLLEKIQRWFDQEGKGIKVVWLLQ